MLPRRSSRARCPRTECAFLHEPYRLVSTRVGGGPLHHAVFAAGSPSPRASLAGGTMSTRKSPRWVIAFLRALARTGVAREAAKDAGIDHTTAYERRKAHAGF